MFTGMTLHTDVYVCLKATTAEPRLVKLHLRATFCGEASWEQHKGNAAGHSESNDAMEAGDNAGRSMCTVVCGCRLHPSMHASHLDHDLQPFYIGLGPKDHE